MGKIFVPLWPQTHRNSGERQVGCLLGETAEALSHAESGEGDGRGGSPELQWSPNRNQFSRHKSSHLSLAKPLWFRKGEKL